MPISAYVGLTGSGKSFNAVKNVILPALETKRKVFTNIPMKNDLCLEDYGSEVVQFETQDLIDNPKWFTEVFESGSILVFDEAWELWPAGMTSAKISVEHKTFIAKHRHDVNEDGFSTEIVFCTQDLTQLATFATLLIDFTYVSNSLEDVGLKNRFRVDIYKGHYKGLKVSTSKRQREYQDKVVWKNKGDAGRYYISNTNANGQSDIKESRSDKRFNVFGGFKTKLIVAAFLGLCIFLYFGTKSFITDNAMLGTKIDHNKNVASGAAVPVSPSSSSNAQIQPTNKVTEKEKDPIDELDIVSLTSQIFVVGHLDDTYYFKLDNLNSFANLTSKEMNDLGYTLKVFNPCLIKITGYKLVHFAMCQDARTENTFVQEPF